MKISNQVLLVGLIAASLINICISLQLPSEYNLPASEKRGKSVELSNKVGLPPQTSPSAENASCHDTNVIDYALRLVGCDGKSLALQAGRLEIFYKGGWGTVCRDSFDRNDAQVACYSLGYVQDQGLFTGDTFPMGQDPTQIVLDDLNCRGDELALDECVHSEWTSHNCRHEEDVTIACAIDESSDHPYKYGYLTKLVDDNNPTNLSSFGRLEIFHRGEWGTVCDDGWINNPHNARAACQALGLGLKVGRFANNEFGRGSGRIWLDSVDCTDIDRNIGNCAHEPWGVHDCNHDEDVSLICAKCFDEFCENGGSCLDENVEQCICLPGYTGVRCETRATNCNEANCVNGGSCVFGTGSYYCQCPVGFTGAFCESTIGPTTPTTTTTTTTRPTTTAPDQTEWPGTDGIPRI